MTGIHFEGGVESLVLVRRLSSVDDTKARACRVRMIHLTDANPTISLS